MSTYRALSGFGWAVGLVHEIDFPKEEFSNSSELEPEDAKIHTDSLLEKLKGGKLNDQKCNLNNFAASEGGCKLDQSEKKPSSCITDKYVGNYNMEHTDFDIHSKTYSILHVEQYSWSQQGYEFTKRYFSERMASLFDEEINHIYSLTYNKLGKDRGVDTRLFRRAVWVYIHRIQGFLHDDYNYDCINEMLPIRLKMYIKKLTCKPYLIEAQDLNVGLHLSPSEKAHIALLASCSRKLIETLYGIVAILKYLKKK
eukprot:TRINITY_DN9890_c0_g1_i3.p2 TRINITY_DN9890_c0_g1~~TRINITY_DN9890_c0_g1_i3.p2  ORF type:complete len:255 (+),score=35.18 TRINITY_DN9890_c0_g1_i3:1058-1822(+)